MIMLTLMAGLATIASPCVLPMLPFLLGTAIGQQSRTRPLFILLGFTLTFCALALLFIGFANALHADLLRKLAIIFLLIFGMLALWKRPMQAISPLFNRPINYINQLASQAGPSHLGGLVLGSTLGAVWTPCAGPVLGSVLTMIASSSNQKQAMFLLFNYALGAGLPMIAIAYGGQYLSGRIRKISPYLGRIQKGFGLLILLQAIAILTQYDTLFTAWLSFQFGEG
jgi:cytochrome c-type biogenesis protein